MASKTHKLLALLACFGVVCAHAFAGQVVCTTDTGHYAIEAAHVTTGCPAAAQTEHAPAEKPEPCEDRNLVGDLVVQAVKANSTSVDAACLTLSLISSPSTLPHQTLVLFCGSASPPPCCPAARDSLATVILLI
jgi:hypothetical protein